MALLPTGQWVRWTNLPSAADFQFTDLHRYSRCKQRFSLSFAAIDISLHANYALVLLNTNYTNKVYHQYSVPTIFQVVTPISFFEKCYFCIVLQKISCTRQFESQLSLRSLASLFPIKEGIFRKPTRPSLSLRKAPPLISVFSPQARRRKPPYSVLGTASL